MKHTSLKVMGFVGLLTLSNCSIYEDSFKCPMGKGESCKSLSYVDQKADQGAYEDPEELPKKSCHEKSCASTDRFIHFFVKSNERMTLRPSEVKK